MGVLDLVKGRNDGRNARGLANPEIKDEPGVSVDPARNSASASLEAQQEKEIEAHPDVVSNNAQEGLQKVEAAALVNETLQQAHAVPRGAPPTMAT